MRRATLDLARRRTPLPTLKLCATVAVAIGALSHCADPLRERNVALLGPEAADVPVGPLHRQGQPCLACHDGNSHERAFSVAGTVYVTTEGLAPAVGVFVELTDADHRTFRTATNCAGNFFVEPADFTPRAPYFVALTSDDYRIEMDTPVQREGSCASCHGAAMTRTSAGRVYLHATPPSDPPKVCR